MKYIEHPLIRKNTIQSRVYQEMILGLAAKKNLLCVLPTGLGKTPIAIMLAAHRLQNYPDSQILIMAPTKPLTEQHLNSFQKILDVDPEQFKLLTGQTKPEKRAEVYKKFRLIFATPQTIENDLETNRLSLENFSMIVFDEAHHAIGNYAYPYVAKRYAEQARNPKILGLTASPGGTKEKIHEICKNLGIEAVEIKTEADEDVAPYVKEKIFEWVDIDLPENFKEIKARLEEVYRGKLKNLRKLGFTKPVRFVTKKDLLALQLELQKSIRHGDRRSFWGASMVAQLIKLEHAIGLLETQGVASLNSYWKKMKEDKSKAAFRILKDKRVSHAVYLTQRLFDSGFKHPKIGMLCSIVSQQLKRKPNSKIIIFANYRNTVKEIVSILYSIEGARPVEFMGQKEGMTQKEQIKRINAFREGEHNILVGTSVSEEGIDIPSMDLAVFYEPVPSEIRSIQRRGRVGRQTVGRIIVLITKGTRDEAYYWTAKKKEKTMKKTLYKMKEDVKEGRPFYKGEKKQFTLRDF